MMSSRDPEIKGCYKVVGDLQRLGMKFGHELNHMVDICWTSWFYRSVFFQVIFSEILYRPFLLLHPYVERVCMHQCDILWMCFFGVRVCYPIPLCCTACL